MVDMDLGTAFSGMSLLLRIAMVLGVVSAGSFGFGMLLGASVVTNPGQKAIHTSGGEFRGVVGPGIHPGIPFYDSYQVFDMRQNLLERTGEDEVTAVTADDINVKVSLKVRWDIDDSQGLEEIYKETAKSQQALRKKVVLPAVEEAPRMCATTRVATEIVSTDRSEYRDCIRDRLRESFREEGLVVNEVELVNLDYPPSLQEKFERARQLEEQRKIAQQKVEIAKKESREKVVRAQAEAKASKEQAKAIRTIRGELTDDYIRYYAIEEGLSNADTVYVVPAEGGVPVSGEIPIDNSTG